MTNNQLSNYLDEVREALGNHPEREDIIQELQAHIWDYANSISRNSGCSVDDAFHVALQSMEDPEKLAESFKYETDQVSGNWTEPRNLPEKKLSDRDFLFIGTIGFFAATIILSLISWIGNLTGSDLSAFNFAFTLIQFVILIGVILGFLYYRNEQEFDKQLRKLRDKFDKRDADGELTEASKTNVKAFELHFEGFFELLIIIFFFVGLINITYIQRLGLFTQLWYDFMIYVMLFLFFLEILQSTMKLFVGEIRASRLVRGIVQIFSIIGSILLIVLYPFDLQAWFATFQDPTLVSMVDWIYQTTPDPDHGLRVLFGIIIIFEVMSATYNFFKFGTWKPSDHRSLTIKQEE